MKKMSRKTNYSWALKMTGRSDQQKTSEMLSKTTVRYIDKLESRNLKFELVVYVVAVFVRSFSKKWRNAEKSFEGKMSQATVGLFRVVSIHLSLDIPLHLEMHFTDA